MLLADIGRVRDHLANSPVLGDPLWRRPVADIQEVDLVLFVARMSVLGLYADAHAAIQRLQGEAIKAVARGELDHVTFLGFEPWEPRFAVDELVDGLARMPVERRSAALYALERNLDPARVIELTWHALAKQPAVTGVAGEILLQQAKTRHIKLPYVFWEFAAPRIAAPLLHLRQSIEEAFGFSWPSLLCRYQTLLPIDRHAEAAAFLHDFARARLGQLQ